MSTRYFLLAQSHAHFCTVSPLSVVALADLPTFCATVAHEDSGSIILRLHYFKVKEAQRLVWVFLVKSLAFQFLQGKFPKLVKEHKHLKKGQSRRKFTISCLRKKSCPSTKTPPSVRGVNGLGTWPDSSVSPKSKTWSYCHIQTFFLIFWSSCYEWPAI